MNYRDKVTKATTNRLKLAQLFLVPVILFDNVLKGFTLLNNNYLFIIHHQNISVPLYSLS
jgi:hypothetical protein